jgi:hypothetical protein
MFAKALSAFPLLTLLCITPSLAAVLDVTGVPFATLEPGQTMAFEFGVWNYGLNNPEYSPYPTSIGFQALGLHPEGATTAPLPGTTQVYLTGYLFEGFLESLDGSVSVPLMDSLAARLGYGPGYLLAAPSTVCNSAGCPLETMSVLGTASFSLETSAALFGPNLNNYQNAAMIVLRNLGQPFVLGLGEPYTAGQSFIISGVSGAGPVQTAGIRGSVTTISNPEPSTFLLCGGALAAVALARISHKKAGKSHRPMA